MIAALRLVAHLALSEALHALRQPRLMAQLFMLPIIFSVILAVFSVGVFVYGLKLPFPIWPPFITG